MKTNYQVGDVVRITEYEHGDPVGSVVLINEVDIDGDVWYGSSQYVYENCNFIASNDCVELVKAAGELS